MSKIFIDLPTYSNNSNGIVCLYDLSHYLHGCGFSVYGVPRNLRAFLRNARKLPSKYQDIPFVERSCGSSSDFFIAADTVSLKTIQNVRSQGIRVIWWALAPYRLLDGKLLPDVGDISLPYSSYVDPYSEKYYYYQPDLDDHFLSALRSQATRKLTGQLRVCVYTGKGRIANMPRRILDICKGAEISSITRKSPPSRAQLFELLGTADCMLTFDELSAINLEAAALGVPVFLANPLFSPICRQKFSINQLKDRVVSDEEEFLHLVSRRREQSLHPWVSDDLLRTNQSTLSSWKEILELYGHSDCFNVSPEKILYYSQYTKALTDKKVISVHKGGQPGGSCLATYYIASLSTGKIKSSLLALICALDYLYIYLWPLLLLAEKFPIVRKIRSKGRNSPYLFYIQGKRVYR